ncbi:DUF3750 domain-containing protein [Microvirga brassicacearum]|uniref:DUF3750 domain-containing protein n=1 Tax=Microvirga brassicacearum TaxID=2580413 RepID=A0A5N3PJ94_9HYPH|nr:DUF3750 domain-containing protein [Microvirga brassicacearum]KAB0269794.1 DUF3750 domain-containing protein [Microvirga brassicacearum]
MMSLARLLLVMIGLFVLPLGAHAVWWAMRDDVAANYRQADWSSARLLSPPAETPQAIVAVYAARVGRWRGIFAHHTWVVVKEAGADRYTRYDKVGWGSPVRTNGWAPDGRWFGNAPRLIVLIEGEAAQRLIPQIQAAVASYPYRVSGDYNAWPGPNSNTFVAHVMRSVPELSAALPPTALGKNWQPFRDIVGLTPSRTGVQISLGGYAGLSVGWIEGIEVDLLGLVAGIDIRRPAIKIPGWGRIGMEPIVW